MRALERRLFACVPRAARALLELASEQPAPRGGLVAREHVGPGANQPLMHTRGRWDAAL